MSRPASGSYGKGQAPRPNAAQAKVENERYDVFKARLERIAAAAARAGRQELADELVDLSHRVLDREITLDEGLAELREHESELRSLLKR
jgi:cell fate (sporulation/competence/biofilm development) regulator YlbF (YheA/YmcA/DUF963 family)